MVANPYPSSEWHHPPMIWAQSPLPPLAVMCMRKSVYMREKERDTDRAWAQSGCLCVCVCVRARVCVGGGGRG